MINIQELIQQKEYDFVRNNVHLKNRIMFLTMGGSHAYGTNIEGSDVDVRGVTMGRKENLLGTLRFEQFEDRNTDTVIYSANKFIQLVSNCNPNTIEMLGGKPEMYTMVNPAGKLLLENKGLFLSKRAAKTFCGYAFAQLKRLEYAARKNQGEEFNQKEAYYIANSIFAALKDYRDTHREEFGGLRFDVTDDGEIYINGEIKDAKIGMLYDIFNISNNVRKQYDGLNHRNRKPLEKIDKHAMHLVRLYYTGIDILEKGKINTYRAENLTELMEIRNGKYRNEDGTYKDEFFEYAKHLEERLRKAEQESPLPNHPDMKKIEDLLILINEIALEEDK